jgi:hypothetical protein
MAPVRVPVSMAVAVAVGALIVFVCGWWLPGRPAFDLGVVQAGRGGDDDRADVVADVEQDRGTLAGVGVLLRVRERPGHDTAGMPGVDE